MLDVWYPLGNSDVSWAPGLSSLEKLFWSSDLDNFLMWPTWSVTIILPLSHLDLYLEVYITTFQAGVSLCWQTTVLGREPALIFVSTKTKENAWILAITNSRNMGFLSATCSSSPAYRILQSIRYLSWCSCTPQLQDVPVRLSPDSMHSTLPHSRPKYAWVIFYSTFLSSSTGLVSYSCLESQSCSGFFRFFRGVHR